jgi:hypothetical protein
MLNYNYYDWSQFSRNSNIYIEDYYDWSPLQLNPNIDMNDIIITQPINWEWKWINPKTVKDCQFESVPKSNKFKNKVKNKKNYSRKSSHKTNRQKRSNRH